MDVIIYFIIILIIIGTVLLTKNHIKYKIKEGLGGSIINENEEEEEGETSVKPEKDSDGYELVGSAPPPSYEDAIYDYNLKYAKKVWEDLGCDPQSKYAPNIYNKDKLFDSTHGWAREDYKFRVKSLNVEANKAEYNYYDWGKYKFRNTQTQEENELGAGETTAPGANTEEKANLWNMDKQKIGSNWKSVINRPEIVRYPMGMRKAQTLCFGKDPGDYTPPKIGDKVKIRQKVSYNSPYFAGIVVADKENKNDNDPVEVLWYQKGTATIEPKSNKIVNYFNNDYCDLKNLSTDEDGCTRNLTQSSPPEEIIDVTSDVTNSIGWKLYGSTKNGGNGQQDWFGSPDLSLTTYSKSGKTLDKFGRPPWESRYLKDTKKKIPEKLINYDSDAKLKTIKPGGDVDPRAVFKIKECQEDSACEDLRCSTIAEKIKKRYPLTKVCRVEKKNTYSETNGQYCEDGNNKGAVFTYYNEPPLCSFQDYGGEKNSDNFPKTFCKPYCGGNCKDISKMKGNWTTSYYAEVWSKPNYKGNKAIVRGIDGVMDSEKIFPEESGARIKSMKVRGSMTAAMLSNSTKSLTQFPEHNDNMIPILKGVYPNFERLPERSAFNDEVKNTYVKGNNIGTIDGINEMECKDACISKRGCTSIDYVKKNSRCWLNHIRLSDPRAKNLRGTSSSDTYYELNNIGASKSFRYIEICKFHIIDGCPTCKVYVPTDAASNAYFEDVSIPNLKIKYLSIHGLYFGDQNWGNVTTCNIRGYHGNGKTALNAVITYDNKKGNRGNGGYKQRGNFTRDTYGNSLIKFKEDRKHIGLMRDLIGRYQCDLFMDFFLGDVNRYWSCSEQEARHKKKMEYWNKKYDDLDKRIFSQIRTSPNANPDRLYKVSGTKKVNRIRFGPSTVGSGHASIYLGFGNMKIYETLK